MYIYPIYTQTLSTKIEIESDEVLHYMGCNGAVEEATKALAQRAIDAVQSVVTCKACYRLCEIDFPKKNVTDFGLATFHSSALYRHLRYCEKAFVFAATIGIELDRLLLKNKCTSPSYTLALQAAGAATIENYCDILCNSIFEKEANELKLHTVSRFSAGYGDLPIESQKEIFDALDCSRKIGLTLTETCMMMPSKSVTAFVGLCNSKGHTEDKCSSCTNLKCIYRKESDQI